MLSVILGSDRALAKHALDRELENLDPSGNDTDRITASLVTFEAIYAAVTAVPFFGTQRVIVLEGMLSQASSKGGRGTKAKADSDVARLVAAIPNTTHLILFEPELAELSATARKQLPEGVSISSNEAPRGQAIVELAQRLATKSDSTLERDTAIAILDRLFPATWKQAQLNRAFDRPPSVEQLESEITKLALAAYPEAIEVEIVEEMIPQRIEERIFPLLDAVVSGNQRAAIVAVENAYHAGEDPSRTTAQIYQQIELAVAAKARGRPADPMQAGRALGLANPNRMRPVEQAAQRARVAPARQLRLALENDRKIKTGRIRTTEEGLVDLVARVTSQPENR